MTGEQSSRAAEVAPTGEWVQQRPTWLTGACMAVRRSAFLELGGSDERYFVCHEDMSFGRQVRLGGRQQRLRASLPLGVSRRAGPARSRSS